MCQPFEACSLPKLLIQVMRIQGPVRQSNFHNCKYKDNEMIFFFSSGVPVTPQYVILCGIMSILMLFFLLGHVAAVWKRGYQWCLALTPNNTKTIQRMKCNCFLLPIRRDLTSSSYTALFIIVCKLVFISTK